MYNGYQIKPFIFAGRKATLEILFPLLRSPVIDEIIVGVNTKTQEDIDYITQYANTDHRVKLIHVPDSIKRTVAAYSYMFSKMIDTDTIYIKMDDDIIYISEMFFEKLIEYRCNHPEFLLVYPFIVNNPWCNYIGNYFSNMYDNPSDCMYHSWADAKLAYFVLRAFAEHKLPICHISNSIIDKENTFYRNEIHDIVRPNINAIAFFGRDNLEMSWYTKMKSSRSDEYFLVHDIYNDKTMNRKSIIYTTPYCVHYAFCRQTNLLNKLNILKYYKQIGE